jgi:hypothetical protein
MKRIQRFTNVHPDDAEREELYWDRNLLNPGKWICVVRRGNLAVVRRSSIGSEDYEVMECFLSPGQIPSWFKTNWAVRKHWPELRPIAQVNLQRCDSERQR